jgi:hypothetical protein
MVPNPFRCIAARALKALALGTFTLSSFSAAFVATATHTASAARAAEVGKGILIIRRGAANTKANYNKEDRDPNGKLMDVSVQCDPKTKYPGKPADRARLIANQAGFAPSMTANSTTFVNAGGHVVTSPMNGNRYHCSINSVTLSTAMGAFR